KWYQRGSTMAPQNWVEKFPFDRKREKFPWGTYEVWEAEGLQRGYDKRNPTSLMKSEDKEERKWYTRGAMMNPEYHWLSLFPFARRKAIKNSISLLESLLEEGGK
ncbi:MAG: hypothetical protein Q8L27_03445, partial [archaeon]|nr:hypothetical protein [archaeon]